MGSIKQSFDLTDKVAVITGGAGMLGEKHAEAIAEFGGIQILLDIDQKVGIEKAKRISDEYKVDCEFKLCDITDESQILNVRDTLLSKYGRIDILINNAAIDPKVEGKSGKNFSRLEHFDLEAWNNDLNVGLTGAFICSKYIGKEISNNPNGGSIINISSDLGLISPDQRLYRKVGIPEDEQSVKPITYSVVKSGLLGLTRYLATYWAKENVRCNAICPGGIFSNQDEEFLNKLHKLIPLGRMARPDEYKGIIVFLCSDAASYMNGAIISIDGGRTTW